MNKLAGKMEWGGVNKSKWDRWSIYECYTDFSAHMHITLRTVVIISSVRVIG